MSHLHQIMSEVCKVKESGSILPTPDIPELPSNIAYTPMPSKEKLRNLRSRFDKKFTEQDKVFHVYIMFMKSFQHCCVYLKLTNIKVKGIYHVFGGVGVIIDTPGNWGTF